MEPSLETEERLRDVLRELMKREPLFHRSELVNSRADFEREIAADFWQTGASGRRYSRDYVWALLEERYETSDCDEFELEHWETRDFQLREIASRTYLLTYALWGQGDRLNDADVNGSSV
jgi:hypothetical protein